MSPVRRVLHLVSSADRRGAQVFATQLVAELGGSPTHELVAIAPATTGQPLAIATLGDRRTDAAGMLRLVAGLRDSRLLVAHGSSALLHATLAGALTGRPFIYRNIGDPSAWGAVRASELRIGLPLRRAAAVAALYPGARHHLIDAYRLRPERVTTISNAVPSLRAPSPAQRASAKGALSLVSQLEWVGFMGALSEEKGVLAAVEAVRRDRGLGMVVAGDGPQAPRLAELVETELPTEDRARFRLLGVVEDPRTVLDAVEVLIIPSRTEGVPAVAIEAGLSGVPVVATDVGGVGEVVIDDLTGVLVPDASPEALGAGLRRALGGRDELGAEARRHCEQHFTMPQVAAEWSALIDRVSAAQPRPASSR